MDIYAIAREIDPSAFDHIAITDRYWRHRWESAVAAAKRVADLLEHPEGRPPPSDEVVLQAPVSDLKRAITFYRGMPTVANGETLLRAVEVMLGAMRK